MAQEDGLSVTIKYPESVRYKADNPWLVFHGSVTYIREAMVEAFGLDESALALSLADLVIECQGIAGSAKLVSDQLGGRALRPSNAAPSDKPDPWASPAKPAEVVAPKILLDVIAEAETVDALKSLWVDRQSEFKDNADAVAAWKARGKKLEEESK